MDDADEELELRALRSSGWPVTGPGCRWLDLRLDLRSLFSGNEGWGCAPCDCKSFLGSGWSDLI
jgi:hypothetical protein